VGGDKMLGFNVNKQFINITDRLAMASDSQEYITARFTFDSDWDGLVKTATFYQKSDSVYHMLLDEDGTCIVPHEVLEDKGYLYIGVFGVSGTKRITTNIVNINIVNGSYGEGLTPDEATEDIYAQIIALMEKQAVDSQLALQYQEGAKGYRDEAQAIKENVAQLETAFNENATSKTTAFNDNATAKTNSFDENASEKVEELNVIKTTTEEYKDLAFTYKENAKDSEEQALIYKNEMSQATGNYYNKTEANSLLGGKLDNSHNSDSSSHNDIREEISIVEAIARGKSRAIVFNTEEELNAWLLIPSNVQTLEIGDNFYIRDVEVPDYWWDGTEKKELEAEKVDLSNYYIKTDADNKFVAKEAGKGLLSDEEKALFGNINQDVKSTATPSFAGATLNGLTQINTPNATTKGLIVKGFAGQTANLQEWQDSAGNINARIVNSGSMFIAGGYRGLGLYNSGDNNNSSVTVPSTGTVITRNVADGNSALIVNQINASSTGNIIDCQASGVNRFYVTRAGVAVIGTTAIKNGGMYFGSDANAYVNVGTTGTTISRNVGDGNSALIVNQIHASSTGDIIDAQWQGTTRFRVSNGGIVRATDIANINATNNSYLNLYNGGTTISRNVGDTNTCLTINQVHASSTGNVLDLQFGGTNVARVDRAGNIHCQTLANNTSTDFSRVTMGSNGTLISRNVADGNDALIVNLAHESASGNIQRWQHVGSLKAQLSNSGAFRCLEVTHVTTRNNALVEMHSNGVRIRRNVADANPGLVVDLSNTNSTGNIVNFQTGGVTQANIDKDGVIQASGYKSADGSTGATGSFTSQDGKTVTVKNGLITNIA
jgi:hypothetical protein